jgi:hypothetical protein
MVVVIVVAIAITIAVTIVIPIVAVFKPAVITFPVAVIKPSTIVARTDPTRACIRRTCPIACVPAIMPAHWVPVTIDPDESRSWTRGMYVNDARRWWRTDPDTNTHLSVSGVRACEQHREKQTGSD